MGKKLTPSKNYYENAVTMLEELVKSLEDEMDREFGYSGAASGDSHVQKIDGLGNAKNLEDSEGQGMGVQTGLIFGDNDDASATGGLLKRMLSANGGNNSGLW